MVFYFPQRVHVGQGISQKFGLAAREAGSRVLLLVDGTLDGTKELGVLTHSLERASIPHLVLSRSPRQNLTDALQEALTVARASRMDILAALGGADQLSLGRAAAMELGQPNPIPYLEVPISICYPLLLRPETFLSTGHASDVRFQPFRSHEGHQIFIDPHMATNQSPKASVASLLEALFYAVEALLHEAAGLTEQSLLLGAVEAIWALIRKIYENPANAEYRLTAAEAGFDIALACAVVPRGAGLSFAYTLAGLAGLSTSAFGSLLLAPLLEFRAPSGGQRMVRLARAFGVDAKDGDGTVLGPRIAQDVRKFLQANKLPLRLADYKLVDTQITQAVDVVRGLDLRSGGVLDVENLPAFIREVL